MFESEKTYKVLWLLALTLMFVLAFIGIPWAWLNEGADPKSPIGALVWLIKSFSIVFVLSVIVVAIRWSTTKPD
ncbi:hypothetical protein DET61_11663 [Marinobacter nauticus]|jgi:uncharacterized membrane protein|uniref:Uncharacterized protein n=1 Tax=Marinobacter nauticus TaxID=2743 RepID=A0A368X7P1_MARNT|nr:hypothetical protein [Marinobacter nauticus]RCW64022.1 hypothetical protein DET61_11663 [Marinobacter nauticus]